MTDWYAAVTCPADKPPTDAQLEELLAAVPGFSTAAHNAGAGLLRLAFQVEADDELAARARAASIASDAVATVLGPAPGGDTEPVNAETQPIPPLCGGEED